MPRVPSTPRDHRQQARRNTALAGALAKVPGPGQQQWAAIIAFYAALHWIESDFSAHDPPLRPETHDERLRLVSLRYPVQIDDAYRRLYRRSRALRYDCDEVYPDELPQLLQDLAAIHQHVQRSE